MIYHSLNTFKYQPALNIVNCIVLLHSNTPQHTCHASSLGVITAHGTEVDDY